MLNVYSACFIIPFLQPSGKAKYYKDWELFFYLGENKKWGRLYFRTRYLSLPGQKDQCLLWGWSMHPTFHNQKFWKSSQSHVRDRPGELVSELHYVQAGPTPRFLKMGQLRSFMSPTHPLTIPQQGPLFLKTTFQASLRKQVSSNLRGTSGSKIPPEISRLVLIPLRGKWRVCLLPGFLNLSTRGIWGLR